MRAKIALDVHDWKGARDAVEDGLRIARDCGFWLYHIDLMILRGRVALAEGDVAGARDAVEVALSRGVRPPEDSGLPVLLAATDPECGYAWGEEDGRALLAEIEAAEIEAVEAAPSSAPGRPHPQPPSTDLIVDEASSREGGFDVFLCHNSQDKDAVREIGRRLRERGLRPWIDEWELRPGLPWQDVLEAQIADIGAAAVFVGPNGDGPWQQMELKAFLQQFVKRRCPVIPVILPGVDETPKLPPFLALMTWVDFRRDDPDPLDRLIWGITGEKPD